jgi:hypothetical protein
MLQAKRVKKCCNLFSVGGDLYVKLGIQLKRGSGKRKERIMISRIPDTKALKKSSHVAFSRREETATPDEWYLRLMRRIRQIRLLKPGEGLWPVLENLFWGLAPGSSILIAALTILCVRMYLILGHDYLTTVAEHLGKLTIAPALR